MSDKKELTLEEIKAMNVYQRIHAIQSEVGMVGKEGYNDHQKYKYAKEADFVKALKPLLNKYRLIIVPNISGFSHPEGKPELVDLKMMFTIINIDNPADQALASMAGQGKDNGDKAIFKAIAGTKKYFMGVTFQMPTGDDPEESNEKGESTAQDKAPANKPASFRKPKVDAPAPAAKEEPKKASGDNW